MCMKSRVFKSKDEVKELLKQFGLEPLSISYEIGSSFLYIRLPLSQKRLIHYLENQKNVFYET